MKNNRLIGIIAFVIAILLVGGLTYYEFTQVQPKYGSQRHWPYRYGDQLE